MNVKKVMQVTGVMSVRIIISEIQRYQVVLVNHAPVAVKLIYLSPEIVTHTLVSV